MRLWRETTNNPILIVDIIVCLKIISLLKSQYCSNLRGLKDIKIMDNGININQNIINWAILRSGMPMDSFLRYFPKLQEWGNKSNPSLRQLQNFSKKVSIPLGYLFLDKPVIEKLPIPDYRALKNEQLEDPSPQLLEVIHSMQRRQEWFRDYIIENGIEELDFVGSIHLSDKIDEQKAAADIKSRLGLVNDWAQSCSNWEEAIRVLINSIEQIGIMIVFDSVVKNNNNRKLDLEEFRGFVLSDKYAPLIFVNSSDAKAARMFTVAHELAHIWLGAGGVFNFRTMQPSDNKIERICDKIAAELLVPKNEFRKIWSKSDTNNVNVFEHLAKKFKVSPLVCARRALDTSLISRKKFFDFYNDYIDKQRQFGRKSSGGNFYFNQKWKIGRIFSVAIKRAVMEGNLLYRDAYSLTGLNGKVFDKYIKGVPIQ